MYICNQEVAYGNGFHREADCIESAGVAGVAGADGLPGVWGVVSREAGRTVHGGPGFTRIHHAPRLRARPVEAVVEQMEHERLFSFTWPHAKSLEKADYSPDYTGEPTTLVEFRLEETSGGTLLLVTESGFDKLPGDRRQEAFRRNEGGWTQQMKNIENHVRTNS